MRTLLFCNPPNNNAAAETRASRSSRQIVQHGMEGLKVDSLEAKRLEYCWHTIATGPSDRSVVNLVTNTPGRFEGKTEAAARFKISQTEKSKVLQFQPRSSIGFATAPAL
eukprot:scaffold215038_cov40-Attheya_sp.AAC.3